MIRLNSNVSVDDRGLLLHNANEEVAFIPPDMLVKLSTLGNTIWPYVLWFDLISFGCLQIFISRCPRKKGCPEGLYILTLGSENFGVQNVFFFVQIKSN